jgi:deoxyadenosine/deoxycytidine kinase
MRIAIEGNIGAGKSTVLERLSQSYRVLPEPIDQWKEWLELFYQDKKRWAFAFQMKVLLTYAELEPESRKQHCVIERSIVTGRHVFTQMMYNQGILSEKEWMVYRQFYDLVEWTPDAVVYIKTDPETCLERIQKRQRKAECDAIDIAYLNKIDFHYSNMMRYGLKNTVVHVVDGNKDEDSVAQEVEQIVEALLSSTGGR